MKLYEYECQDCHKHFEELVKDPKEPVKCPHCGSEKAKRVELAMPKYAKHESWRVT
jgi:putative FmdB family regulatory protein